MRLLLIGLSHHTAPVEIRERVDFASRGLVPALSAVASQTGLREVVVLSTCNRSELYAACDGEDDPEPRLRAFLSSYHEVSPDTLAPHLLVQRDSDVARHLFRVAAGLDSLILGEPQILGQVKQAYAASSDAHHTGPLLNRLFHSALQAGKRVRSETAIAEGAVSVSSAAVGLARKIFGDLRNLQVLVVGAGEMSRLTARHLRDHAVGSMVVTSRTPAHADELATEMQASTVPWSERALALESADIVITATGARTSVISRAAVKAAMHRRGGRPLFLIDIAVPRDVDPGAGAIDQVFLYDIDDLHEIVRANLARRAGEIARAEAIVEEDACAFAAWLASREAIPAVIALRQRFESIRRAELQRLDSRLAMLAPDLRDRVDELTRLIVDRLLLAPTEELKALTDRQIVAAYAGALRRLLTVDEEDGEGSRATLTRP
jgi:glutamyl-tRNA reductase